LEDIYLPEFLSGLVPFCFSLSPVTTY